ncbi:hypothetical protein RvY_15167 [Ramazzottius varieornatus]|uniref:RBR-type E3 ubiquitin transferase n=1 Tax=Ramazzottius varieornatus TaxID=947166 RepID=A0A1D1VTY8_RAMVA|nr:hypothetical protein RvY_15167 [Ramazzottius varieornatus]
MELAPDAPREVRCPTCRHDVCTTYRKKQIREERRAASEAGREALKKRIGADNVKFALEDAESEEWISKNAKSCPKCNTPIQKSDGCNKMVCTAKGCKTYFCWLFGKRLDSLKPYEHFLQAGNGACSGMLYTRIGPDGALQQVPQPYMAPDVNRMLQQAPPAGHVPPKR